jgi:homoserine dehydrogenase
MPSAGAPPSKKQKTVTVMRVGLVGGGTVGGGVCEILRERKENLEKHGVSFRITTIAVRDAAKKRDFVVPEGCTITTDPLKVATDPDVDMVVELMGGVTLAKDVVMAALKAGKHVITGNKALIAAHLPEIEAAVKANDGATFGFEAAVCGGIPIIHTVTNDYVGDKITSIMGIMNGTTNFILHKMETEGAAYADVLAEAQALGYAETPPDFDVEGWDARSKLAILCKLAFGGFVPESSIPCTGITRVSSEDFDYAKQMNSTIKILGVGQLNDDGSVSAYVSIAMVPFTNQLSRIAGAVNSVAVTSKNMNTCNYSGPGAGRFPTANSVVSDMVMIAKGGGAGSNPFPMDAKVEIKSEVAGRFYVRFTICDGVGIIRTIGALCEQNGISIHSILQTPIKDRKKLPFVLTTEATTLSAVKTMCAGVSKLDWNLEEPLIMPIFN